MPTDALRNNTIKPNRPGALHPGLVPFGWKIRKIRAKGKNKRVIGYRLERRQSFDRPGLPLPAGWKIIRGTNGDPAIRRMKPGWDGAQTETAPKFAKSKNFAHLL